MKSNKRNAVLYKEMTVDIKKPKAMIIILLVNLFLIPIAISFFVGVAALGLTGMLSYRILSWYFIAMIFSEMIIITFLTPAMTAGCISLEKERQTLDVLLTTRMTPWEIIKGKYFSVMILLGLIIMSTLPILSIVFIYGGTSIIGVFIVLLELILYTGFVASIGVFFSALTKNTVLAVIFSYITLFIYSIGTFMLPVLVVGVIEIINAIIASETAIMNDHFIFSDIFALLGVANPFGVIFDTLGKTVGYQFSSLFDDTKLQLTGMDSVLGEILPHFTEKNLLLKAWSIFGEIWQVLITFLLVRVSAVFINPVKRRKRKVNIKKERKA